jgi:murein L,D-transpeptidase YcbB/YkuD
LRTFKLFGAAGMCLLSFGGNVEAQDAREFWQSEWQRQPRHEASLGRSEWGRAGFDERSEARQPTRYSPTPQSQRPQVHANEPRRDRRKMPTIRVANPTFFTYVPDKLTNVELASACKFAITPSKVLDTNTQDGTEPGSKDATDLPPAVSPDASFVQACASTPAIAIHLLPQVGAAIVHYYSAHPHFLWSDQGGVSAKAHAAIAALAATEAVGLNPADYRVTLPELSGTDAIANAQALLRFEFALSGKVLTYVLDATRGRIDPNRLSGYHDLPRKSVDLIEALAAIAQSSDVAAWLSHRNPDNPEFGALVAELAKQPNGMQEAAEKLRMAMERLRWLRSSLGTRYVFLNQPAFEVTYINGSSAPLTMRAVIGRPDAQTYFFTDRVKEVIYNPYWSLPRSIVINEMLPKLWRHPSYLDRLGYEVSNSRGRQVASNAIDWAAVASNEAAIEVRQPPGPRNALGQLKIDFPNKHAIYMHDTPQKHLFTREQRAFSHGCVRLQHPREMAAALLGSSVADIDRKIARGETQTERVRADIPIYLAYFTAWPDARGTVRYYKDVYGRDAHLAQALAKTSAARSGP